MTKGNLSREGTNSGMRFAILDWAGLVPGTAHTQQYEVGISIFVPLGR
jgi:hypothetical protein